MNLYDHLTQVLMKVMDEHPQNVVDVIEDISHDVKRTFFEEKQSTLRDLPQTSAAELLAEKQRLLFAGPEEDDQEEKAMESPLPNMSVIGFYWEQAGVGLGREEMLRVFLALKQLVESQKLLRCRLWGKILGTESSYIVAEAEYRVGEVERSSEESAEDEVRKRKEDPLPPSTCEPLPALPEEILGKGANKCVYYVCKEPGLPWVKLPSVSPAQIIVARQIRKFFTGRLDNPVVSYPPFTGNEANYLRAQIARISAGTQVSPEGFYKPAEDEYDEEDEEAFNSVEVNPDFEGISVAELAESLSTWVHHVQHILQQGRCTLVDLAKKTGDDSNEEGEAEEREADDKPEQEVGPPLLTRLSEDAEKFNIPPWTLRVSSTLTYQHALAVIRSNLWPGAYAYSCGKTFENIYVGWGLKYAGEGYSPPVPPPPQNEYPSGPDITEALDSSMEEELGQQATPEKERDAEEELEDINGEDDEEDDD
ncbi:radial spoke head protein 4 homolog A [Lycodopsis pacificus]